MSQDLEESNDESFKIDKSGSKYLLRPARRVMHERCLFPDFEWREGAYSESIELVAERISSSHVSFAPRNGVKDLETGWESRDSREIP